MSLGIMAHSEKSYHQCHIKGSSISLLEVEVDLVVLSKELTKLADLSTRIVNSLHELRLSQQEQELQD